MVIVRLVGGLGNQLFQYALGLALSNRTKSPLLLDIFEFEQRYKRHKYSLSHFRLSGKTAKKSDVAFIGPQGRLAKLRHLLFKEKPARTFQIITESGPRFDPKILHLTGDLYLRGYWQTEKYFIDIRKKILGEFRLKGKLDKTSRQIIHEMEKSNSVSIHIRRGDYVSDPAMKKVYYFCDLNYYSRAMKFLKKKVANPVFFVFSDDKNWAKENLKGPYQFRFMNQNDASKNYLDLWLMSKCKHNIIANSTFSWWGAWLNNNSNKIVVAPKGWLRDKAVDTSDLVPQTWVRL